MSNIYFRKIATDRWPGVPITGAGPFALCSCDAAGIVKSVYLTTEETARAGAYGVDNPLVVNLMLDVAIARSIDRMVDRHPD